MTRKVYKNRRENRETMKRKIKAPKRKLKMASVYWIERQRNEKVKQKRRKQRKSENE